MSRLKVDQLESLQSEVVRNVDQLVVFSELEQRGRLVNDFGALGNGAANDAPAIQAAIDDLGSAGGTLILTAGTYRITQPLTITNSLIKIVGAGSSATTIFADGCNALTIDSSGFADNERVVIMDVGFETNGVGTYKGIVYQGRPGPALGAQLSLRYCSFTGRTNNTAWQIGVEAIDAEFSEIIGCFFRGHTSDVSVMQAAIKLHESTDVKVLNNYIYWSNKAVLITGFSEGITVANSHMVPVTVGVEHKGTGNLVWVINNHISADTLGVNLGTTGVNSVNHCQVNNNLIFKRSLSTSNFTAIALFSRKHAVIGNEILIPTSSAAGGTQNGIVLHEDAIMCRIVGNQIADMDTGILIQSGADRNTVLGNTYQNNNNNFIGNGSNITSGNISRTTLMRLSGDQAIPNAAATNLSWGTVVNDDEGLWSVSTPSRLSVPSHAKKVRLRASVFFESNNTGARRVSITKNGGAQPAGSPSDRRVASFNSTTNISTAVMLVSSSDYFEVQVEQTSGGSLDVQDNGQTWFELEVVE